MLREANGVAVLDNAFPACLGCGAQATGKGEANLCPNCSALWLESPERERAERQRAVALGDFRDRVRKERAVAEQKVAAACPPPTAAPECGDLSAELVHSAGEGGGAPVFEEAVEGDW